MTDPIPGQTSAEPGDGGSAAARRTLRRLIGPARPIGAAALASGLFAYPPIWIRGRAEREHPSG